MTGSITLCKTIHLTITCTEIKQVAFFFIVLHFLKVIPAHRISMVRHKINEDGAILTIPSLSFFVCSFCSLSSPIKELHIRLLIQWTREPCFCKRRLKFHTKGEKHNPKKNAKQRKKLDERDNAVFLNQKNTRSTGSR